MSIDDKVIDHSWAVVEKIEAVKNHSTKISVRAKYGRYSVDVPGKLSKNISSGDVLETAFVIVPSEITDFVGQKPEAGDVVTQSYELAYLRMPATLYEGQKYIYRRKKLCCE